MAKKWDSDAVMKLLQKRKDEENVNYQDQRFWNSQAPKKGDKENVYRIRVLPNMMAGGQFAVKINRHGYQAPSGVWFIENCPTTIHGTGKGICPSCDYAGPFFNTGDESDKKFASMIYRKQSYIANILVIKDPRDGGANEGKVFLWRFGQKLYKKLDTALFPPADSGLEQIMFIDPYKGYDLNLVVTLQRDGKKEYPNYDTSVFVRESTPIGKNDEEINKILESCYDIETEFLAPKQFKSYDELNTIFTNNVINYRKGGNNSGEEKKVEKDYRPEPQQEKKPETPKKNVPSQEKKVEMDDSDAEFLKQLEADLNK